MEGGVEHEYAGNVGHDLAAAVNRLEMGSGVQRSEIVALFELRDDLLGDEHRFREVVTAVNYAVTDCADLAHVGDNAELGIGEGLNNESDG